MYVCVADSVHISCLSIFHKKAQTLVICHFIGSCITIKILLLSICMLNFLYIQDISCQEDILHHAFNTFYAIVLLYSHELKVIN